MTNLIYQPKGRAREYAALACNVYGGCDHRCVYCYAPDATFRPRCEFEHPRQRSSFIRNLRNEIARWNGARDPVLLCFTCDPYQSLDTEVQDARRAIMALHDGGFPVTVLTKGGSRALRDLDLFTPADAFASTLTLLDPVESARWEPGAAPPDNRIRTLKAFHDAGIPTWVSLEPVLDPDVALEIIRRTHSFVDLFKVGKLNYHPRAQEIDWAQFAHRATELLEQLGKQYYLKKDLIAFLG